MTDEQLSAIRARAEAATPGPWEGDDGNVYTEWSRDEYADERGYEPQGTGFDEIRICEINAYNADISDEEVKANEQFIANASTDIPALLDHIEEQRKETAHLRRALDWLAEKTAHACGAAVGCPFPGECPVEAIVCFEARAENWLKKSMHSTKDAATNIQGEGQIMKIISCAILLSTGCIVSMPSPARHHHILNANKEISCAEQGFLTDTGQFVDRKEAHRIAESAGQIVRECGGDAGCLFSENLW